MEAVETNLDVPLTNSFIVGWSRNIAFERLNKTLIVAQEQIESPTNLGKKLNAS